MGGDGDRVCAIATVDAARGTVQVLVRVEPGVLPSERSEVLLSWAHGEHTASLGAVEEAVEHHYAVTLVSREAPGQSWRHAAGWHLSGASFVPEVLVDGQPLDLPATLLVEVGQDTLFTSAGPGHRLFDAPSLTRLAGESYEVGGIMMTRREIDEDTLWVGATGRSDGELEVAADTLASLYRRVHDELGDGPTASLLVVLHAPGDPESRPWAERSASSLTFLVPPSDDIGVRIAGALRPLVQLWFAGGSPAWVAEGLPEYLATRVALEELDLPSEALARTVLGHSTQPANPVSSGLLTSFCLDTFLRERGSSLAAVLRSSSTVPGRSPDAVLTVESLLPDVAAISPAAAGYFAALAGEQEPYGIDPCLERLGFHAEPAPFEAAPLENFRAALGIEAWSALERLPMLRVNSVSEGSAFETGDLLWQMEAVPLAVPEDVAWALRGAAAGDEVVVELRRRGERVTERVTLGELPAAASIARTHHSVVEVLEP